MGARVVVAEDDVKQADVVRRYLELDRHEVVVVHDGGAALAAARATTPDLVILDVMMPGLDGLEVCRTLRAESDVAILMLTARASEDDLLLGLDLGADDYLTKPYSPRELAARVRTLLRRSGGGAGAAWQVGDLKVDPVRHEVSLGSRPVDCTPGEFAVLTLFAREPGRVFTRDQVISHVHGVDGYLTTRTVDVHVMNLRRKLEDDARRPQRLLTVYGVGYKLVAPRA
ncbi:response regulator transcription factor [Nocardioides dongxiaopingii]|uniref:response regulator transcription factor n=1 Tax=Nocardioides sp. S-1144 TaxID=2582905 RepID=UPI00110E01DB|nr:response regulator transcription factor [Nocardioides sp. S-1144]QCW49526.1 response regulator transcription factor [Nocardioides sp. S-1144]